jgi:hypothetical protein
LKIKDELEPYFLHHDFHYTISGGAVFYILFKYMYVVDRSLACVMRKSCAIAWSHFIDRAFVIGQVQELAWLLAVYPVALPVFAQVFQLEFINGHSDVSGDTHNILPGIGGRHCFAAVGARKAIGLLPHFEVGLYRNFIKSAGRSFAEAGKKAAKCRFVFCYTFAKYSEINGLHNAI